MPLWPTFYGISPLPGGSYRVRPSQHYDDQLAALVGLIALINSFNRMNVIVQQPAGDYQVGKFG